MAETNITKIEPMNLSIEASSMRAPNNFVDNLSKNVKFDALSNIQNSKSPGFNFTQEQVQLAQQMSNLMQQQLKQAPQVSQPTQMSQPTKSILKDNKMMGGNVEPPVSVTVSNTNVPDVTPVQVSTDYYSLFGFQLSKMTVYIIIGFIVVIVAYLIYSKWFSAPKEEKKKKKKQAEVSYQEQEKISQDEE